MLLLLHIIIIISSETDKGSLENKLTVFCKLYELAMTSEVIFF